jgi:hypothetical protein
MRILSAPRTRPAIFTLVARNCRSPDTGNSGSIRCLSECLERTNWLRKYYFLLGKLEKKGFYL